MHKGKCGRNSDIFHAILFLLIQVVNKSSKANIAQLVTKQGGTQLVAIYDWTAFFSDR